MPCRDYYDEEEPEQSAEAANLEAMLCGVLHAIASQYSLDDFIGKYYDEKKAGVDASYLMKWFEDHCHKDAEKAEALARDLVSLPEAAFSHALALLRVLKKDKI